MLSRGQEAKADACARKFSQVSTQGIYYIKALRIFLRIHACTLDCLVHTQAVQEADAGFPLSPAHAHGLYAHVDHAHYPRATRSGQIVGSGLCHEDDVIIEIERSGIVPAPFLRYDP
jgi:hypothetical protein